MPARDDEDHGSLAAAHGELTSPFLGDELFVEKAAAERESRLSLLEAESPFRQAFAEGPRYAVESSVPPESIKVPPGPEAEQADQADGERSLPEGTIEEEQPRDSEQTLPPDFVAAEERPESPDPLVEFQWGGRQFRRPAESIRHLKDLLADPEVRAQLLDREVFDLRTSIVRQATQELRNWRTAGHLRYEYDKEQFGHLVRYWLTTHSGHSPAPLSILLENAVKVRYSDALRTEAPPPDKDMDSAVNELRRNATGARKSAVLEALRRANKAARDDNEPWSAAFVVFCARAVALAKGLEERVGADALLQPARAHLEYVRRALERADQGVNYRAFEPRQHPVLPGDIVVLDRNKNMTAPISLTDVPTSTGHRGHGDIVVEVNRRQGYAVAIGGNLGDPDNPDATPSPDSVRRRRFPIDDRGRLIIQRNVLFEHESNDGTLPELSPSGKVGDSDLLRPQSTARIFALLRLTRSPAGKPKVSRYLELEAVEHGSGEDDEWVDMESSSPRHSYDEEEALFPRIEEDYEGEEDSRVHASAPEGKFFDAGEIGVESEEETAAISPDEYAEPRRVHGPGRERFVDGEEEVWEDLLYFAGQGGDFRPGEVVFPSGVSLRVLTGLPEAEEQEYWDPTGSGNPLLDTGPAHKEKKLSTNFTVRELTTSGGISANIARIDPRLVDCLQRLRDYTRKEVKIISGYRSWKRNSAIYARRKTRDGTPMPPTDSQHCGGRGADVEIKGMNGLEIAKAAIDAYGPNIGVGLAQNWAHIDVRTANHGRGMAAAWKYGDVTDSSLAEIRKYQAAKGGAHRRSSQSATAEPRPQSGATPAAEHTRFAQRVLNAAEGEKLKPDAVLGPLTRVALERFRGKYSLGTGGVLDEKTLIALVQRGLEEFRQQSMFGTTGVLDAATRRELIAFKSTRGLGSTSDLDAATLNALGESLMERRPGVPRAPSPAASGVTPSLPQSQDVRVELVAGEGDKSMNLERESRSRD
jgi:hypothetical protein